MGSYRQRRMISDAPEKLLSVMVAEDDQTTHAMFKRTLKMAGFAVISAFDGEKAIDLCSQTGLSLVLLDVSMPKVSGLEVLKSIRATKSMIDVPVIVCTADSSDEAIQSALDLGANDYLIKPLSVRSLMARVNLHLSMRKMSQELAAQKQNLAIAAMVVTYNHEINNPLSIVVGNLESVFRVNSLPEEVTKRLEAAYSASKRIVSIIKKIRGVPLGPVTFEDYSETTQMISLELPTKKA